MHDPSRRTAEVQARQQIGRSPPALFKGANPRMRRCILISAFTLALAFIAGPASAARIIVTIDNLRPGTYAVGAYHDENGNDHLDTNFLGLPVEGYALSNGVRVVLSKPTFQQAAFTVGTGDKPLALHIRY